MELKNNKAMKNKIYPLNQSKDHLDYKIIKLI